MQTNFKFLVPLLSLSCGLLTAGEINQHTENLKKTIEVNTNEKGDVFVAEEIKKETVVKKYKTYNKDGKIPKSVYLELLKKERAENQKKEREELIKKYGKLIDNNIFYLQLSAGNMGYLGYYFGAGYAYSRFSAFDHNNLYIGTDLNAFMAVYSPKGGDMEDGILSYGAYILPKVGANFRLFHIYYGAGLGFAIVGDNSSEEYSTKHHKYVKKHGDKKMEKIIDANPVFFLPAVAGIGYTIKSVTVQMQVGYMINVNGLSDVFYNANLGVTF